MELFNHSWLNTDFDKNSHQEQSDLINQSDYFFIYPSRYDALIMSKVAETKFLLAVYWNGLMLVCNMAGGTVV